MSDPANPDEGHPMRGWHLDKRVPIALIAAIAMQSGVFGIWVGTISSRVTALESRQERLDDIRDRTIRLETLAEAIIQRLDRQESRGNQ